MLLTHLAREGRCKSNRQRALSGPILSSASFSSVADMTAMTAARALTVASNEFTRAPPSYAIAQTSSSPPTLSQVGGRTPEGKP
jgi:hypothetical protein